jgi:hypothetical protein
VEDKNVHAVHAVSNQCCLTPVLSPPSLKLIFHTKYPNNFRASLRSAQVF